MTYKFANLFKRDSMGVELLKINCGDFNFAPDLTDLKKAADFIESKIKGARI